MVSIRGNSFLNPDWFVRKGSYAIVKEEYKEQVRESLAQAKAQAQNNLQTFFNKPNTSKVDCGLTEQQKTELAGRYNPTDMSRDEYNNFVDDLCSYGVIPAEAKGYIASSMLRHWNVQKPVCKFPIMHPVVCPIHCKMDKIMCWIGYATALPLSSLTRLASRFKKVLLLCCLVKLSKC